MAETSYLKDGTLDFLPHNLNRQPIIMGGLTADEMWGTVAVCSGTGLVLGIPVSILFSNPALFIVGALVGGALGLTVASRILRKMKRGRPDTWFYRQLQFYMAQHLPFLGAPKLVTRKGAWTCRRSGK
ncbi:TIGR03750 family conjugal transfer protein [Pseudomonas putida]|uniref:TIGR03750 family conjugal transfer protein n=1 Tax=Pseudomonas putida TaxID=303 RepID=UPI001F526874|nr:TIGR03750 family conjugal transfer protein [Pseudomonas putida]MCI1021488.1 TIGR03750 family conjugal transfer protein [Pseudomonas putida]